MAAGYRSEFGFWLGGFSQVATVSANNQVRKSHIIQMTKRRPNFSHLMIALTFTLLVTAISGCGSNSIFGGNKGGEAETKTGSLKVVIQPDGKVEVSDSRVIATSKQPENSQTPATATVDTTPAGATTGTTTTGASQHLDQALAQLSLLIWIGGAMIVLGIVGLAIPTIGAFTIPRRVGMYLIGAGAVLVATPIFLDRYSKYVFIIGAVLGLAALVYEAIKHHWISSLRTKDGNTG